jgi:ABC-type multidrug transport system fused ATPase/permease subunit
MKIIFRILAFVRQFWYMFILAAVCLAFGTGLGILIPNLLGDGIDAALGQGSGSFLFFHFSDAHTLIWWLAGVIVITSIVRGFAGYGQRFFNEVIAQKTTYFMRNALYERIQRLSFSFHDRSQTGQLMSRATVDIEAVRMFLAMGVLGMLQIIVMILVIAYLMLAINTPLALFMLAFIVPVCWLAITFHKGIRPVWQKVQAVMGFMGNTLEESLAGISVVKAFSHEKEDNRVFAAQARDLSNEQIKAAKLMGVNAPSMGLLFTIPTAIILWYGGRQVVDGSMTIGQVTEFILYMGMLVMPVRRLGMLVNLYSRTISAGQRIIEILDTKSDVTEKPHAVKLGKLKGAVSFKNVSFSYNNIGPALKNVSFDVKPGQLVALLGRSGSGKSTIANLLGRFYDVTEGSITVDGTDIRDVTLASLRKNVVAAQQDVFLFSATIKENIAYGAVNAKMDQIIEVAKAANLHQFIQALSDGYDTWVGERGDTLSGGEKQRLSIARTLLMNPSILILDDSTASVDAETEKLIRQALDKLIKNRTTFIITHRIPIIQNADLILMLEDGNLVEKGTHNELLARNGVYKEIYESQLMMNRNEDGEVDA